MTSYTIFNTPFCTIILMGDQSGISGLHLDSGKGKRGRMAIEENWVRNDALFAEAHRQIEAYCRGELTIFNLPLQLKGTPFQKSVWHALTAIPYGEVRTYGEIATAIGNRKASRAVGMANSKNPIPLIIPCHRVIGANGTLTGFAHGIELKKRLLAFERQQSAPRAPV